MKHCGKSTHGKALADYFGCPFFDTDAVMQKLYFNTSGEDLTTREFFKTYGSDAFSDLEQQAVFKLQKECSNIKESIISTGGRLPCNPLLQKDISKLGFVVFLRVEPAVLFKRVARRGIPPFLVSSNPKQEFLELYVEREPYYLKHADLIIDLVDQSRSKVAQFIITKIEEVYHARK